MTSVSPLLAAGALALLAMSGAARAESYDTCTGFIETLPATISTQGTWCLRHDLSTAIASGKAIQVTTNNVTIDCNGFKIGGLAAGTGSQTYGIYAHSRQNITVRNCTVRGFYTGLYLFGSSMTVEDNRFDNNLWKGITVVGEAGRVLRNQVVDTGGGDGVAQGIAIHASADVIGNSVYNVFGDDALANTSATGIDIYTGRGHVVRENNIAGLISTGSGASLGIRIENAGGTLVESNHLSRTSGPNSTGILDEGLDTFCNRNTVYFYTSPLVGCDASSGNQALP